MCKERNTSNVHYSDIGVEYRSQGFSYHDIYGWIYQVSKLEDGIEKNNFTSLVMIG